MDEYPPSPVDDAPGEHRESINLRLRLRQVPHVARRAAQNPSWLLENVRLLRLRRAEQTRRIDLPKYRALLTNERNAVHGALGVSVEEYDAARKAFWAPNRDPSEARAVWDARHSLQSLVSVTVRLVRPTVMVETGVARGYTTAIALAVMADLGKGHLYSVDFPALEYEGRTTIGEMVPSACRSRWTLTVGPSRVVLPRLTQHVAPIDIFLHDSDHTYKSQMEEYTTVWPFIRPGGVLMSDDVQNDAFVEFASNVGVKPFLIGMIDSSSAIGIVAKPGGTFK